MTEARRLLGAPAWIVQFQGRAQLGLKVTALLAQNDQPAVLMVLFVIDGVHFSIFFHIFQLKYYQKSARSIRIDLFFDIC